MGPFDIGQPLPASTTEFKTGGKYPINSLDFGSAFGHLLHAVGVLVHLIPDDNATTTGPITLAADPRGSIDLTITNNQVVTAAGVNIGSNAAVILSGSINGDVNASSLLTQDGAGLVSDNGLGVVSHDGGTVVSHDGGTWAAIAAASLKQQTDAPVISNDGGTVVSNDGGTLIGSRVQSSLGTDSATALSDSSRLKAAQLPGVSPTQPAFTGQMTVHGNYTQSGGAALLIAIAGTNTISSGAQQYDQLVVSGHANFVGGHVAFGLFNPDDQTNQAGVFQPPDGATFDVVIASNIVTTALLVRGPIWGDGLHFHWGIVTRPDGLQALRLVATHVPPPLVLRGAGGTLQIVYPTNYTGYNVQSSPTLSPADWTPFSTGANVVTLDATNESSFFRLVKP